MTVFRSIAALISLCALALLFGCGGCGSEAGTPGFASASCDADGSAGSAGGVGATGFERSGTGASVFDLPGTVDVVRIQATYPGTSENFAVLADGRLIVNEIIGTTQEPPAHDGTYSVPAGSTIEITQATGVNWVVTASSSAQPPSGSFSRQGQGAAVFDLPARNARYRVRAAYSGSADNFALFVAGRLVVNEIVGTAQTPAEFDGTFALGGGQAEVRAGGGVTWSITELP
jgi:hypothetical protein